MNGNSDNQSLALDDGWDGDGMQDLSISPQIELGFPRSCDLAVEVDL